MREKCWSREFDEPIDLPRGRKLVTLEDAGNYITKLPKAEHTAPEWQTAMQALMLVAKLGGHGQYFRVKIKRAPDLRSLGLNDKAVATLTGRALGIGI
jgi:hypothetical protein